MFNKPVNFIPLKLKRILCFCLSLTLVASMSGCQLKQRGANQPEEAKAVPAVANTTVSAEDDGGVAGGKTVAGVRLGAADYPAGVFSEDEVSALAMDIAGKLKRSSINSVFYEVNSPVGAVYPSDIIERDPDLFPKKTLQHPDPLKELITACQKESIMVYALFNPYIAPNEPVKGSLREKSPESAVASQTGWLYRPDNPLAHRRAVAAVSELSRGYQLSGVALFGVDEIAAENELFFSYLNALQWDCSDTLRADPKNKDISFGIVLRSGIAQTGNRTAFLNAACRVGADFLIPEIFEKADGGKDNSFTTELGYFEAAARQYDKGIIPLIPGDMLSGDSATLSLLCANSMGITGGVLGSYEPVSNEASELLSSVIPLMHMNGSIMPEQPLTIPSEFAITKPLNDGVATLSSEYSTYFITGTASPNSPVYIDGEEIDRISENGSFGVLVELSEGENTFMFSQDSKKLEVKLERLAPGKAAHISKISTYTSGSGTVFQPFGNQAVNQSIPLIMQCTAPFGGTVTALLDGVTYELKPTATAAEDGIPVIYKKEVIIPERNPDSVENLGKVTYTLEFNDESSEVEAPGEVFLIGSGRKPLGRITAGIGTVLNPSMEAGDFMTTLKPGSIVEIVGQTANYFKTSYGGSILKTETEIVTDLISAENVLSAAEFLPADKKGDERIVLHGTLSPSFIVESTENGSFSVRLINTSYIKPPKMESTFFSGLDFSKDGGDLIVTLKKGVGEYFGYNVNYSGQDTILTFYQKPELSNEPYRPLVGTTIVLDPGHGDKDTGALGVAGLSGPLEKDVNLYISLLTRRLLEGLGADVVMTRERDDEFLTIDERVAFTEAKEADLFISLHHNSLDERIDGNKRDGVWVFYYNDISSNISDVFLKNISNASGRRAMGRELGWYVVCRNTLAPSVLLEFGFMPNPKEYESICDGETMLKLGQAVSESVVSYISSLKNKLKQKESDKG